MKKLLLMISMITVSFNVQAVDLDSVLTTIKTKITIEPQYQGIFNTFVNETKFMINKGFELRPALSKALYDMKHCHCSQLEQSAKMCSCYQLSEQDKAEDIFFDKLGNLIDKEIRHSEKSTTKK